MIALDSNLLIYAHRRDSQWHEAARPLIERLAEGGSPGAIPWPCVHEFLSITTHPSLYNPPSTLDQALGQLEAWIKSPTLALLSEGEGYWERLSRLLHDGRIAGPKVHDARIAALCLLHGVTELWSADRDFSRFPALRVRNPLVG